MNVPMTPDHPRHSHELLLRFTVPGEPVAKGRPRFAKGRAYTPRKTRLAEDRLRAEAWVAFRSQGYRLEPQEGPLAVIAHFYCGGDRKPDLDNLVKLLDAFNGMLWRDDRQIVQLSASRHDRQLEPRTEIAVYRVIL